LFGAYRIVPEFRLAGFGFELVDAFQLLVEVKDASGRRRVFLGGLGCGFSALSTWAFLNNKGARKHQKK
jgi:hypothetical protein